MSDRTGTSGRSDDLRSAAGYLRRWSLTKDDAQRMADTMVDAADRIEELTVALRAVVNETTKGSPVSAFAAITRAKQVLADRITGEDSDNE